MNRLPSLADIENGIFNTFETLKSGIYNYYSKYEEEELFSSAFDSSGSFLDKTPPWHLLLYPGKIPVKLITSIVKKALFPSSFDYASLPSTAKGVTASASSPKRKEAISSIEEEDSDASSLSSVEDSPSHSPTSMARPIDLDDLSATSAFHKISFSSYIADDEPNENKELRMYRAFAEGIIDTFSDKNIDFIFSDKELNGKNISRGKERNLLKMKRDVLRNLVNSLPKTAFDPIPFSLNESLNGSDEIFSQEKMKNPISSLQTFFAENKHFLERVYLLDLSNKNLSSLPKEIGLCKNLRYLALHNNLLSFFPEEMKELTQLEKLYLHTNSFSNFPKQIATFKKLKELSLSHNQLKEVPSLEGLSHLTRLYLNNNRLTSTPSLPMSIFKKSSKYNLENNPIPLLPISIPGSGIGRWTIRFWLLQTTIATTATVLALGALKKNKELPI